MAERKKAPQFVSPKLTLRFPKLDKADFGSKDYPKPDGEYSTKGILVADDPATKAFIKQLTPLYDEAMAWADEQFKKLKVETRKKLGSVSQNPLFSTLYDKETEEPTGEIEFKFAMAASGIRNKDTDKEERWTAKPGIFDAKGQKIVKVPAIWSGSTAKVSFSVGLNKEGIPGYFIPGTGAAGLKLKLLAVQIIDLRQGGERSADSYGFGAEEGYAYDPSEDNAVGEGFTDEGAGDNTPEENPDF